MSLKSMIKYIVFLFKNAHYESTMTCQTALFTYMDYSFLTVLGLKTCNMFELNSIRYFHRTYKN